MALRGKAELDLLETDMEMPTATLDQPEEINSSMLILMHSS